MAWEVAYVLPNLQIKKAIESEFISLVPFNHPRVRELRRDYSVLNRYLSRFSDAVGQRVKPSVILHRHPSPKSTRTPEAFGGFRDLLAMSVVPEARARGLTERIRPSRVLYSNSFDPYPWIVTNDYENILLVSPAVLHFNEIDKFRGHTHPELSTHDLQDREIDEPLLARLIEEWSLRFTTKKPTRRSVALFRSMNMASQAARMPAATSGTLFDIGRLMILWASAFEILIHPGYYDKLALSRIYDLLETIEWDTRFAKRRIYKVYGNPGKKRVAACWLYSLIHQLRNDFIHGNPVDRKKIVLPGTKGALWMHAAPLYRLMLTAYLPLKFARPLPPLSDPMAFAAVASERIDFLRHQKLMEEAVRSAKPRSISRGRKLRVYDRTPHQRVLRAGRVPAAH